MKFLSDILAKAGLVVDGTVTLNSVANATTDTDKFLTIDSGVVKFRTGAQLLLDIGGQVAGSYVPTSRILTINGTAYDLSADRSWTITAGVSSVSAGTGIAVNSTTGAVTVTNTGLLSATAGSGISVTTTSGTLNIVNTGLLTATAGAGISVSTVNQNLNIVNTGLLTATAGSGISVSVVGQNLNIVSTGVLTATAGSGISLSVVGQNLNVVNTGILTATAGAGISLSVVSGNLNVVNTITNNNQLTNGAGYITLSALNGYATETYVGIQISNLVDAAPGTLNTLNELAAALGDDPNFATTVATSIGNKVSKSGDTMTGNLTSPAFIKSGGTSSEFLKADGSVDSSVYLTTTSAATLYVPYSGATTDVNLNTKNLLLGQGSVGSYILMVGNAGTNYLQIENAGNRTRYQMDSLIFTNKQFGGTKTIYFNTSASTGTNYTISFPDKNGTVAMTSDIPSYTETDTLQSVTTRGSSTTTVLSTNGGKLYFRDDSIENSVTASDSAAIVFNYLGYNTSNSYFRDVHIYNGKSGTVAFFDGSSGYVGIGTTSPGYTLQIGNTGANYSAAIIGNATAGIEIRTNSAGGRIAALEQYFGNEGSLWLYLSNSTKVLLRADGASYFNGGSVGIGTTLPGQTLHVYNGGGILGYKTARFDSNDTGNGTRVLITNSGNTSNRGYAFVTGGSGGVGPGADNFSIGYYNADSTFITQNIFNITSSGFVGVNTLSAYIDSNDKFVVAGGRLAVNVGAFNPAAFNRSNGGAIIDLLIGGYGKGYIGSNGTDITLTSYANLLVTATSVGIGTSSPTSVLHLVSTGSSIMKFFRATTTYGFEIASTTFGLYDYTNSIYRWRVNNTDLLLNETSGNVGIGLTNPQAILDVSHTAGTTNIIRVSNGSGNYRWRVDQNFSMIMTNASGTDTFSVTTAGTLTAISLIKSGGTSSQYLMADGSVSTNPGWITSYTETDTLASVTGRGNSTSQTLFVDQTTGGGYVFRTSSAWGGWARHGFSIADGSNNILSALGGYGGSGTSIAYMYIGKSYTDYSASFNPDGNVEFRYDNSTRLTVDSGGISVSGRTLSGWGQFSSSTQGTPIVKAIQEDTSAGYYLFQGVTGSTEKFRVDRDGSGYFANKLSVGTTYAGFAANINGTLYVIGGQIYVNDGYQIQNTSGNAIIQFNSSALAFTGAATFSSTISCTALTETSTIKVKENIVSIDSALDQVEKLQAVSYNRKGSSVKEIGLIAEAVEEVYPEFVQYDQNGEPVGLNYSRLTAVLIESVKELKNRIQELEKRN